jgi:hypothetical protein
VKPKFLVTLPPLKIMTGESRNISVSNANSMTADPCEMEHSETDNGPDGSSENGPDDGPDDGPDLDEEYMQLDENEFDSIR